MDVLDVIASRTSIPPVKMGSDRPDPTELRTVLAAGAAAPDHGKLVPYRFITVTGDARATLGDLFATAMLAVDPDARQADLDKQRGNPRRAGAMIVVVTRVVREHKIPTDEQVGAGAAAMQNMLLAAHAKGLAGKWVTGKNAYDPVVRAGLGCAADEIITGFLYLGSLDVAHPPSAKIDAVTITTHWDGRATVD